MGSKQLKVKGYRILSTLGSGGMGTVYKAEHELTGKIVAIKILSKISEKARFSNEARVQANLSHPNVCKVYGFGETAGLPFIVMEYVKGATLGRYLQQHRSLDLDTKVRIFQSICEGAAYLHGNGVVHRDLKPENIKVDSPQQVKIFDFGISKGLSTPKLTATGHIVGTVQYMAPERLEGINNIRTDVWSLGIILYFLCTDRLPFADSNTDTMIRRIKSCDYPSPEQLNPSLPPSLKRIIGKCLQKSPSKRYRDGRELIRDINEYLGSDPKLPSEGMIASLKRNPSTRKVGMIALAVLAVVIFIRLVIGIVNLGGDNDDIDMAKLNVNVQNAKNYTVTVDNKPCKIPCYTEAQLHSQVRVVIEADGFRTVEQNVTLHKSQQTIMITMMKE